MTTIRHKKRTNACKIGEVPITTMSELISGQETVGHELKQDWVCAREATTINNQRARRESRRAAARQSVADGRGGGVARRQFDFASVTTWTVIFTVVNNRNVNVVFVFCCQDMLDRRLLSVSAASLWPVFIFVFCMCSFIVLFTCTCHVTVESFWDWSFSVRCRQPPCPGESKATPSLWKVCLLIL